MGQSHYRGGRLGHVSSVTRLTHMLRYMCKRKDNKIYFLGIKDIIILLLLFSNNI